ncbi:MAG: SAM-dependent methyltransferase [Clostridiales bacterium]|nr:SAM-dependent methyltransferase [Clostridiales bacterium]
MTKRSSPRLPQLGTRLARIAEEVPHCDLAADIGADHGKLSCVLLHSGRVNRMIVSDIGSSSRAKARDLFIRHGLMDRVIISGEDGLHALSEKIDAVVIAGMGGELIAQILKQDVDLQGAMLILSAQTELPLVRETLLARGYRIEKEVLTKESGRFYRILIAKPGQQKLSELELALGTNVHETDEARMIDFITWQLEVTKTWRSSRGDALRKHLKEALDARKTDNGTDRP